MKPRIPARKVRMLMQPMVITITLVVGLPVMASQSVWRCGPDGRVFSDRPCAGGSAFVIDDRRSADDLKAAREQADRGRKLAKALAAERIQRSKLSSGAGPSSLGPTQTDLDAQQREREVSRLKGQRMSQPLPQRYLGSAAGTSAAVVHASRRARD
jgi:hypothetical protein